MRTKVLICIIKDGHELTLASESLTLLLSGGLGGEGGAQFAIVVQTHFSTYLHSHLQICVADALERWKFHI